LHAQNTALREKKNHMNHIFDTEDQRQSSTQLKFLKTLIDKLIKGRKHPTGAPPSSGMTNFFRMNPFLRPRGLRTEGQNESYFTIHFLTMKKMKNSHPHVPHVPHVPQVQPVGQDLQAPFRHGIHQGENTQRVLRHPLGRPTTFMVSFRTTCAEFRSIYAEFRSIYGERRTTCAEFRSTCGESRTIYAEFRSILRIQIQTYIILCLITTWRQSENKIKKAPEAPDAPEAPEAPVKHHHSRKAEKKQK